jgi:hypothetical protein
MAKRKLEFEIRRVEEAMPQYRQYLGDHPQVAGHPPKYDV